MGNVGFLYTVSRLDGPVLYEARLLILRVDL